MESENNKRVKDSSVDFYQELAITLIAKPNVELTACKYICNEFELKFLEKEEEHGN